MPDEISIFPNSLIKILWSLCLYVDIEKKHISEKCGRIVCKKEEPTMAAAVLFVWYCCKAKSVKKGKCLEGSMR